MSKSKHTPKRKFSIEAVMLKMEKGDVEYIPFSKCKTEIIRVYATKLKNTGLFEFKPSIKGMVDSTQLIRIK